MAIEDMAQSSAYLVEAYKRANIAFEEYQRTQADGALMDAVRSLCDGLQRLQNDQGYWASLVDLEHDYLDHQAEANAAFANVDAAFGQQYAILEAAFHDAGSASRLISDVTAAIDIVQDQLAHGGRRGAGIMTLQRRSGELAEEVCGLVKALAAPEPAGPTEAGKTRGIVRALRVTRRGLTFVAGATLVAASCAAAVANPLLLPVALHAASVGVAAMADCPQQG